MHHKTMHFPKLLPSYEIILSASSLSLSLTLSLGSIMVIFLTDLDGVEKFQWFAGLPVRLENVIESDRTGEWLVLARTVGKVDGKRMLRWMALLGLLLRASRLSIDSFSLFG